MADNDVDDHGAAAATSSSESGDDVDDAMESDASDTDSAALLRADELLHPLEARVEQLAEEITMAEPPLPDDELVAKLNLIAETLEDVETAFRKEHVPPYRREGHLIGNLLQILDQCHEFYPMIEGKLNELTATNVKASVCRVLLATVPMHSRFIIRMLYDEEILERMCEYATDADSALRCYATGLLAVGLRDRSVADIVVNKETPMKLLRRARVYASKLDKERQMAVKYMQEHIRDSTVRQKRTIVGISPAKPTLGATSSFHKPVLGLKRKHSEGDMRAGVYARDETALVAGSCSSADVEEAKESDDTDSSSLVAPATRGGHDGADEDTEQQGSVAPDTFRHDEDLKRLVLLELLHTLDCIGSMGEYLELFGPAHKEDIIGTIITFLHSKNPMVLSHTMKLTSHFLAHKKFSFSFIEAGGVELIFETTKFQQASGQIGLLDRSLSMCLHGFASSSIVVEKILASDPDSLLSVAFGLLSSPNDRARQNAVVFFGLTLPFKAILDYFEKQNGLYTLLNIIRAGNNPKSAAQRQLSHDACLCLRQYLRVHLALVVHRLRRKLAQVNHPSNRASGTAATTTIPTAATAASRLPARVPKLSWLKPVDVDDKAHEQNLIFYEKYRFSVASTSSSNAWSAISAPGGGMWAPAAKLVHLRGVLVMLEVTAMMCSHIQHADEESSSPNRVWSLERAQFCLESLRVLTLVVPGLASEVCSTEASILDETSTPKRPGITLLLELAVSANARDSDLVRDALRVLCNCVSPPHGEECWQHPYKDIRQFTLTARSMRTRSEQDGSVGANAAAFPHDGIDGAAENALNCCSRSKDDKMLRPVRKLARERNAIKVCVQLLRYKRSVQNADAIRLLATRALLGLSRDKQIAQILEKMQVGQLLSDLIRNEPILEENADLHVRFRESALDLISQVTHRAPNAVINEATDPTVRKIEKASIVAQTKISYDDSELLRLIHDHLVTKGLSGAASALIEEAGLADRVAGKTSLSTPGRVDPAVSHGKQSPRSLKHRGDIDAWSSAMKGLVSGPSGDDLRRPTKISRVGFASAAFESTSKKQAEPRPDVVSSAPAQRSVKVTLNSTTRMTPGQRRKKLVKALATPNFLDRRELKQSTSSLQHRPVDSALPAISQKGLASTRSGGQGVSLHLASNRQQASKLDEIITHYLREQHRQCSNPVATIPPFKLLGKNVVHHCPDLPATSASSLSICTRLANRDRVGSHFGTRSFASAYADAGINRYVYSRYRPYRTLGAHDADDWGGVSATRFFGKDQRDVLMGSNEGELRVVNIDTDTIVEQWTCHSESSAIVDLETNEHTRIGSHSRLILTGSAALSPFGTTEIALWDVNDMTAVRWRFEAAINPLFNYYGDRIVALDGRGIERDDQPNSDREVRGAMMIDVAAGEVLCEFADPMRSNEYGLETNCCFSPCDGTVLTDGMLWDSRLPTRALYKFDKLSNVGYGYFHPGGNEVIINSAVWDLRTYKLLRMVPALDRCCVKFNSTGTILYAYYPFAGYQGDDFGRRRSKLKTWFRVLDARDFKDISTIELERPIFDLSIDSKSSLLSVVEGRYVDGDDQDETVCRLYDIGRKKPSEDDSDVEDAHDDSDTLDDDEFDEESESSEEEESDGEDEDDVFSSDYGEYDEGEGGESAVSGEEDGMDGDESDASGMSNREIRFLLELPEDEFYDMHGQYSSDEEDDDENDV